MHSSDAEAQRQSIERALKLALASGELTWAHDSRKDDATTDARLRDLSELAMSLAGLDEHEAQSESDVNPILQFDSAPAEVRPAPAWGLDTPAPPAPEPLPVEKQSFVSSKLQQVALTAVCVVLILAAAAFAGAQLIFAAIDAGARPRPIGIVIQDVPVERAALPGGRVVFPR